MLSQKNKMNFKYDVKIVRGPRIVTVKNLSESIVVLLLIAITVVESIVVLLLFIYVV